MAEVIGTRQVPPLRSDRWGDACGDLSLNPSSPLPSRNSHEVGALKQK